MKLTADGGAAASRRCGNPKYAQSILAHRDLRMSSRRRSRPLDLLLSIVESLLCERIAITPGSTNGIGSQGPQSSLFRCQKRRVPTSTASTALSSDCALNGTGPKPGGRLLTAGAATNLTSWKAHGSGGRTSCSAPGKKATVSVEKPDASGGLWSLATAREEPAPSIRVSGFPPHCAYFIGRNNQRD